MRAAVIGLLVAGLLAVVPAGRAAADPLTARGSVNQVQVTGAAPGASLELHDAGDALVATGAADAQGTFIFGIDPGTQDDVPAGAGYTVDEEGGGTAGPVTVLDPDDVPDQSFYDDQVLPTPAGYGQLELTGDDGFGYVETRDGTTLSVNVMAPFLTGPDSGGSTGPWPTIIDYSGYSPSNPTGNDPVDLLLRVAGFAVVGVNLRGTGCSGGAYSYFEPLQGLDGYDVVEAVAAQPWVARAPARAGFDDGGPEVGMAGVSFPGITQLFVGRTNPPSLAAISPMSVIADTYRSTLYPGGILNNGFAQGWAHDRELGAEPAGSDWAADRISDGDAVCEANQELKGQAPPLVSRFTQDLLYQPDPGDSLAPTTFVDEVHVPTFIAGSFQDEQTGGHWSTMLGNFPPGVVKRAELYNGTHADAITPDVLRDLLEFLDLYVARRAPQLKGNLRNGGPEQLASIFGAPYELPPSHWFDPAYATQDAYEQHLPVVLKWERGAHDSPYCLVDRNPSATASDPQPCTPEEASGAPFARVESSYASWPPPSTADQWFLGPDGALGPVAPTVGDDQPRGWSSYTDDSSRNQVQTFSGSSTAIWHKDAAYDWDPPAESTSLRYVSPPFAQSTAYAGNGRLDLWLRSTAEDTDLEVTLSEVRPDGQETYIQSGWLRASHRQGDLAEVALVPGQWAPATVALFPFAHVVHEGSRLAITISAPGGNRPFWRFDSLDPAPGTVNDVGHSVGRPSALVLPEVAMPADPDGAGPVDLAVAPDCGDLRSQPCRPAPARRPTGVTATIDGRSVEAAWAAPADGAGRTGYEVEVLPIGETGTAAGETFAYEVPVGEPPPTADLAVRVTATYPDGGAPSDASGTVPGPHGFGDVPRSRWYTHQLDWASAWGIVGGVTPTTFRPQNAVNRGEYVGWLWRMFGSPTGSPAIAWRDVPASAWYRPAIDWAVDHGIATGFPGQRFRPGASLQRGQASYWLWQAAGHPDGSPPHSFTDVARSAWFVAGVDWAAATGTVTGFPDRTYRPHEFVNRGQATAWLFAAAAALD